MKYTTEVIIDRPLKDVVAFFENPEYYRDWMQGLEARELLEGETGQVGAKTRFRFKMGKRQIEMMETIEVSELPEEYTTVYQTKGVKNRVRNHFRTAGDDQTHYQTEHEFYFKGLMKLMAWLMPGAFRKQSLKYLNDFKKAAENHLPA